VVLFVEEKKRNIDTGEKARRPTWERDSFDVGTHDGVKVKRSAVGFQTLLKKAVLCVSCYNYLPLGNVEPNPGGGIRGRLAQGMRPP